MEKEPDVTAHGDIVALKKRIFLFSIFYFPFLFGRAVLAISAKNQARMDS